MTPKRMLALVALLAAAPAGAQDLPGRALAERWCAACHVVSAEQTTVVEGAAPTLAAIAASRTDEALLAFLADPHPPMAPLGLTRREAAEIVAYVRSLAPAP